MTNKKKPFNKQINKMFGEIPYEEPKTSPRKKNDEEAGQENLQLADSNVENDKRDDEIEKSEESAIDSPVAEENLSSEDLLEDVRRSLVEVEEAEAEKQPKWWQKFGKGSRKNKKEIEPPVHPEPAIEPEAPLALDEVKAIEQDEYAEQIDDLIEMLDTKTVEGTIDEAPVVTKIEEIEQKEEEVVDFNEMKKRAFRPATQEEEEEISEVRSVALEGGEEVFVEIETKAENPTEERWKAFENALLPYRRYLTFLAVFIGSLTIIVIGYLVYDAYQKSLPPPLVEVSNLPYPTVMYLPGGLNFNLGRGSLNKGRWDPTGPEWLEGTEVCRWVAIPYSRQLEAVVRTLTREDKIELLMSNGDNLTYEVYSITQMTLDDMLKLDSSSPCLLLVLSDAKTDARWVVTAKP